VRRYEGDVPASILIPIVLDISVYAPIPAVACGLNVSGLYRTVKFEKIEAQRLSNVYVYEVAYTAIDKDEQGKVVGNESERIKRVFSTSGWLLEGTVERYGWSISLGKKYEAGLRFSIKLLDTNDEAVKSDLQNAKTQQPGLTQPPQLSDAKYLVAAVAVLVLVVVVVATVLVKKLLK